MADFSNDVLIKQNFLVLRVLNELEKPFLRVSKICEKYAITLKAYDEKIRLAKSVEEIYALSNKFKVVEKQFIEVLAVRNRISKIILRNKQRHEYITKILSDEGIYNEKIEKNSYMHLLDGVDELSEDLINLNGGNVGDERHVFFDGKVWVIQGSKLNLSNEKNSENLQTLNEKGFHRLMNLDSSCWSTVGDEQLLDSKLKKKILKEIATFACENEGKMSISDINKALGSMLTFKTEIPSNIDGFVAGVQNLFAVQAKNVLLENFPEHKNDILKLKCNEKSELIPASVRKIALANGIAGDVEKNEELESEEIRKEKESETQKSAQLLNEILESLAVDEEKEQDSKAPEQEEQRVSHDEVSKLDESEKHDKEVEEFVSSLKRGDD